MANQQTSEDDRKRPAEEDTEAIMSRRRFFIASTLAGAGLGAVLSGCGGRRSTFPEPQPCLSVRPKAPPPQTQSDACLSPPYPDVCLSIDPEVCLTVEPDPGPCLSIIERPSPPPPGAPPPPSPGP